MTVVLIPCPHSDPARPHYMVAGEEEHHLRKAHPEHYGSPPAPNNVQFYSEHAQALAFSQQVKIQKFIEANCIEYVGGGIFVCLPLEKYNSNTYRMEKKNGEFVCTCQGFKVNKRCSHIGALMEHFKLGRKPATVSN